MSGGGYISGPDVASRSHKNWVRRGGGATERLNAIA